MFLLDSGDLHQVGFPCHPQTLLSTPALSTLLLFLLVLSLCPLPGPLGLEFTKQDPDNIFFFKIYLLFFFPQTLQTLVSV